MSTLLVKNWKFKTKGWRNIYQCSIQWASSITTAATFFWYVLYFSIALPVSLSNASGWVKGTSTQPFLTSYDTYLMSPSEHKLGKRLGIEDSLLKVSFKIPALIFSFFKVFSWSIIIELPNYALFIWLLWKSWQKLKQTRISIASR